MTVDREVQAGWQWEHEVRAYPCLPNAEARCICTREDTAKGLDCGRVVKQGRVTE